MNPNWSPGGCIICGSMTGRTYALSKRPHGPVCTNWRCAHAYTVKQLEGWGVRRIILTAAGVGNQWRRGHDVLPAPRSSHDPR